MWILSLPPAAFIRVVGSEFVQKYLGEGPRMVRDVFRLAKENAPAIIFIDEIDAIATKRFDAQTGGKDIWSPDVTVKITDICDVRPTFLDFSARMWPIMCTIQLRFQWK